jgi:hypothetical protein
MVKRDVAEFIDDHGGVFHPRVLEHAIQQGGLPAAEKPRDDGHGNKGLFRPFDFDHFLVSLPWLERIESRMDHTP